MGYKYNAKDSSWELNRNPPGTQTEAVAAAAITNKNEE